MKQIFGLFALLLGMCAANAQTADTVKYAAGNDLYRGITRKLPYRQMVTPYGVEVTFAKTVHIILVIATRRLPTTTIFAAVFGDVFESSAKFKVIAAGGMHDRIYVEIFNVSSTGSAYIIPNVISGNAISFRKIATTCL